MHNSSKKPEGFVDRSPTGFAARIGVSPGTIYSEMARGRLKGKKLRGRTIIPPEEEQRYINDLPDYESAETRRIGIKKAESVSA